MSAVMQDSQEVGFVEPEGWVLTELKPMHKVLCALLAQGMKNVEIAQICSITPQYVTMLLRQPIIKQEVYRISEVAGTRLEAMFEQVVDEIGNTLKNGSAADKMKAARLQMEATKRIGRPDPSGGPTVDSNDRLTRIAERLTGLLVQKRYEADHETAETVPYEEVRVVGRVLEGTFSRPEEDLTDGKTLEDC